MRTKSPEIEAAAIKRIAESGRAFDRSEQRAELLFRNEFFLRDLKEAGGGLSSAEFKSAAVEGAREAVRAAHRAAYERGLKGRKLGDPVAVGRRALETRIARHRALALCERWRIRADWNLKRESLPRHLDMSPALIFPPAFSYPGMPGDFVQPAPWPTRNARPDYIYIEVESWTTREDLIGILGKVLKLQRGIYDFVEKDKPAFSEALCWFDLQRDFRMSLSEIARLWIREKTPLLASRQTSNGNLPEQSFKATIRKGIKRVNEYIDHLTPVSSRLGR